MACVGSNVAYSLFLPGVAYSLFLFGPWAKNNFYTFKWLKKDQRLMCENYVQFKFEHHKVLLEHSHAHLFTLYLLLLSFITELIMTVVTSYDHTEHKP